MSFGPGNPNTPPGAMEVTDQQQRQNIWSHGQQLLAIVNQISNTTRRNAIKQILRNLADAVLGTQSTFDGTATIPADDGSETTTGPWGDVPATPLSTEINVAWLRREAWKQVQALYAHIHQSFTPTQQTTAKNWLKTNVIDLIFPAATFDEELD